MTTGILYLGIAPCSVSETLPVIGDKLDGPDAKMGHGLVRTSTLDVSLPQENPSASETLEDPKSGLPLECLWTAEKVDLVT